MTCRILIAMLALVLLTVPGVYAQDDSVLSFGNVATGEITNRHFEVEFEFVARAGDVAVITMTPQDTDDFRTPGIILLDDDYNVVGEAFDTYSVTLFYDVQDSASYYILATRNDGRSGEGVGGFSLALTKAAELLNGQDLCDGATSELDKYYAIRTDGEFELSYQYIEGDFRPEVSINRIKSRGDGLDARVTLTGPSLERGSLGATVQSGNFVLLIVKIGQRAWDWSDNKVADYRLRLDTGRPADVIAMSIVATSNINIRSGPGTQFDIVDTFASGDAETAIARNEDGSWLRIEAGWVFANLVEPCGDVTRLPGTS